MFQKIFVFLIFVNFAISQEYCDNEAYNCKKGGHVGCNHKGVFDAAACKKWPNVKLVDFGPSEINAMVEAHNKRRNEAALGNAVPGVTGAKLCKMSWHAELAKIASFNVLSCLDDHDKCRNTLEFPYVGQNIYNWYNTRMPEFSTTIEKSVESWYNERTFTNIDHIKKKTAGSCKNGHFTQMVWHNSCFLGCSAATWNDKKGNYGYVVCNYNFGNLINSEIFPIGKPASACETGSHKEFQGLCSSLEDFETPQLHSNKKSNKEKSHHDNGRFKLKEMDDDIKIETIYEPQPEKLPRVRRTETIVEIIEPPKKEKISRTTVFEKSTKTKDFDDFDFDFDSFFKNGEFKEGENADFEKNEGNTRVRYHVRYS